MKYPELKKKVLKESAIATAAIAVLGGAVFALGMIADDYQHSAQLLESEVSSINADTNSLRDKYFKVQDNSTLYQEAMQKNADDSLIISRQGLKDKFNKFRSNFFLNNLRLSMDVTQEMKDAKYRRKSNIIVASEVSVDFDAITDEHVYSLINAMQSDLTGSPRITHLTLSRSADLSTDVLRTISQKGAFPLMKGNMHFTWFGLKPAESSPPDANAPKPKP